MITDENLPAGWTASSRRESFDEMMQRAYESVRFEREDDGAVLRIHEVEEPDDFGGWGFLVTVDRNARETELGVFEDLDQARHRAMEYMADHPADDERHQ